MSDSEKMSLFRRFRYQQFIDWCRSNISAQDYTTINLNAYLNELKNKNVADVINNVINNRLNEGEKLSVHIKVDTTADRTLQNISYSEKQGISPLRYSISTYKKSPIKISQ